MTHPPNRWLAETGGRRGPQYAQRFRTLAESGADVHGEARAVDRLLLGVTGGGPGRVLDAGCGTGRVALELARLGHEVTGVDLDASMIAEARSEPLAHGAEVTWLEGDLLALPELLADAQFDVVAAPGNVIVYLTPGTEAEVVAALVGAVRPGGLLVAGFALDRHVGVDAYEDWCAAAGASAVHRWAGWGGGPLAGGDYVVSVHRR